MIVVGMEWVTSDVECVDVRCRGVAVKKILHPCTGLGLEEAFQCCRFGCSNAKYGDGTQMAWKAKMCCRALRR